MGLRAHRLDVLRNKGDSVSRPILRRTAALAVAGGLTVAAGLLPALPALAHGAPVRPISRTVECAKGADDAGTTACKAALKANRQPFGKFDNLRVSGVNGRDKKFVPDGKLCSGNLPEYRGLDLARKDWPVTRLTAGRKLTVQYRTTIPHNGSFRIYLTKQGYDPTKPLAWGDLGAKPILTADPPVRDGSYRMTLKLPADRSGRHVLYTIWEAAPDTYYSCSDVLLTAGGAATAAPKATTKITPKPTATKKHSSKAVASRSPRPGAAAGQASPSAAGDVPVTPQNLVSGYQDDWFGLGLPAVSAALIVLSGLTGAYGIYRIRRARAIQSPHR